MSIENKINSYEVYARTTPNSATTFGYSFIHSNGLIGPNIESDLFFNVLLTKTYDYYEYVDIKRDERIIPIERQEVNPYFVELSFFDQVNSVGIKSGYQLTTPMVQFIRTVRADLVNSTDQEIRDWFDKKGYFELPWNRGLSNETTLAQIENQGIILNTLIGRAKIFNITINT